MIPKTDAPYQLAKVPAELLKSLARPDHVTCKGTGVSGFKHAGRDPVVCNCCRVAFELHVVGQIEAARAREQALKDADRVRAGGAPNPDPEEEAVL